MTRPSIASTVRALRGITQEKNPKLVAAGKRGAAVAKSKREGVTLEQALKSQRQSEVTAANNKLPRGGKLALDGIFAKESRRLAYLDENQRFKVLANIGDSSELVAKRLVKLALGQGDFENAPASVQRLAMLDILGLAGITANEAEKQDKPVHEMNKHELELFISSTKKLIEKHDASQKGQLIEG